jgi:hypothetical protein
MAARFSASWNAPMLVDPSPNTATARSSVPRTWAVRAAPTATGIPAPTMANVGSRPRSGSLRCIDPPTPPMHPTVRPMISPSTDSVVMPSASATPWPR